MIGNIIAGFEDTKDFIAKEVKKKEVLEEQVEDLNVKIELHSKKVEALEKARAILQVVSNNTQKNLEFHISGLGTLALHSVEETWPEFVAKFGTKRNRPECLLLFKEQGKEQKPLESSGGGCADVASWASLISYWNLNRTAPIFIQDEPFKNVSPDLQNNTSKMVKRVCKELNLQLIMVSHAEGINFAADNTLHVVKEGQESIVTEL